MSGHQLSIIGRGKHLGGTSVAALLLLMLVPQEGSRAPVSSLHVEGKHPQEGSRVPMSSPHVEGKHPHKLVGMR